MVLKEINYPSSYIINYDIHWKKYLILDRINYRSLTCSSLTQLLSVNISLFFSLSEFTGFRLELWCLMPLSTIFQLYRGGQFYWWRRPEFSEKTTDLLQVFEKTLSHNVVSSTPRPSWTWTHSVSGDRHWLHRYTGHLIPI